MTQITLNLASPPDRERTVVQLMIGHEQFAEVNQESNSLQVEIYGRCDKMPWIVALDDLLLAFEDAKTKLVGRPETNEKNE